MGRKASKPLEERGINTETLRKEDMQSILRNHDDFRNEKPRIIHFLEQKGHKAFFLPKFHPEINKECGHKAMCSQKAIAITHFLPFVTQFLLD